VTDTQAQQIVLDKTAEDFRKLHAERQQLVRQWESAVHAMQARDRDIDAASERFREGKAFLHQKAEAHAERDKALAEQLADNDKLAAEITNDERELWKVRRRAFGTGSPRAEAEANSRRSGGGGSLPRSARAALARRVVCVQFSVSCSRTWACTGNGRRGRLAQAEHMRGSAGDGCARERRRRQRQSQRAKSANQRPSQSGSQTNQTARLSLASPANQRPSKPRQPDQSGEAVVSSPAPPQRAAPSDRPVPLALHPRARPRPPRARPQVQQAQSLSTQGFDEITDQIEVMKNTLSKAAAELTAKRDETGSLERLLDEKKGGLERKKRALIRATKELEDHAQRSLSLEQAAKAVEEMARDAEARAERAERGLTELKERMYRESETLFAARQAETNMLAEITGAQRTSRNGARGGRGGAAGRKGGWVSRAGRGGDGAHGGADGALSGREPGRRRLGEREQGRWGTRPRIRARTTSLWAPVLTHCTSPRPLSHAASHHAASVRIRKLDETAQRQRELVYNADFKLQLLERRISRMQGDRTEAEKRDLTKQIKGLTEEVEAATAQHIMLTAQVRSGGGGSGGGGGGGGGARGQAGRRARRGACETARGRRLRWRRRWRRGASVPTHLCLLAHGAPSSRPRVSSGFRRPAPPSPPPPPCGPPVPARAQLKRLRNDLTAAKRRNDALGKDVSSLEGEIADLQLRNLTASNHLKALVTTNEDKMVQVRAAPRRAASARAAGSAVAGWVWLGLAR
jgi:hypothetical protein